MGKPLPLPSDVLDAQMDVHKWYISKLGQKALVYTLMGIAGFLDVAEQIPDDMGKQIVDMMIEESNRAVTHIYRADACYVTKDILEIAMAAAEDMPGDFEFDEKDLLCPYGFVLFEDGIIHEDVNSRPFLVSGFAWGMGLMDKERHGVTIWFLTDSRDQRDETNKEMADDEIFHKSPFHVSHMYPLEFGKPLEAHGSVWEDTPEWKDMPGSVFGLLRLFMSVNVLSHQTLAESRKDPSPRATRRRVSTWKPEAGYVSVITLRHKKTESSNGDNKVEWSHRWIVHGFWRKQPYGPGKKLRKWKYIYDFVKGPKDKPLIVRGKRMFYFRR